jgi:hypothetical protein
MQNGLRRCEARSLSVALASTAEEQPEQDDHWNRYTQQPEQNSASHISASVEVLVAFTTS